MFALVTYAIYLSVALVGTTILLAIAASVTKMPILSFAARSLASYICMILAASYGVAVGIFLRFFGNPTNAQWATARAFKYLMWYTTGVTFIVVEGAEHLETRPAVFVGNHQTELDVLFLGCIFPQNCSVTSKKSLQYVPFLGWFMALSNTVFIDRANRTTALAAFEKAANTMKARSQSVFIFPEGTRSYAKEPKLLPFKKGAFHLAVQAQVDIVPVVSATYSEVLDVKAKKFNGGEIKVKGKHTIRCDLWLNTLIVNFLLQSSLQSRRKASRQLMSTPLRKLLELPCSKLLSRSQRQARRLS